MTGFRYPQFCALARAAELLGERWTIPLLRELLTGPLRFVDLRRRLPGLSPSVLSDRLERLQQTGVVQRRTLPLPAGATVYELTEAGRALDEPLAALTRWGVRFLGPPQPGDRVEPEWIPLALAAFAKRGATATLHAEIAVPGDAGEPVRVRVVGGRRGVRVERVTPDGVAALRPSIARRGAQDADGAVRMVAPPLAVLALLSRASSAASLLASGAITTSSDPALLDRLPDLFEFKGLPSSSDSPDPLRARFGPSAEARSNRPKRASSNPKE